MSAATPKRTILVVDDEPDVVTFLTTLLQDNGYETATAATGAEAMDRIREKRPDLVTLDITMPEKSGVGTYRDIKTNPDLAAIPVVIVTGVAEEFQQFISQRKAVPPPEAYISKPIVEQAFLETIRKLIG